MKRIGLARIVRRFVFSSVTVLSLASIVNGQCTPAPVISTPTNTALAASTFSMSGTGGGITIYNSDEFGGNALATRQAVDQFDDAWRAGSISAGGRSISESWSGASAAGSIPNGTTLFTFAGTSVAVSLQDMPTTLETASHDCDGTPTASSPSNSISETLQDNAPRPQQLYNATAQPGFWNETGLGSNSSRNAVLFTFSNEVKAFGAWFGDVQTRTDGQGRPAIVRLLDAGGNRIGEDVLIGTSTSTANQVNCVSSGAFIGCGNRTTRWIGFVDTNAIPIVRAMLVITGDADSAVGQSEGFTEHISFIGGTLSAVPTAASGTVSGRVIRGKGQGIFQARVQIFNVLTQETKWTQSTPNGNFAFYDLPLNDFYILTVSHKRYQFENNQQSFQLLSNLDDFVFVGN